MDTKFIPPKYKMGQTILTKDGEVTIKYVWSINNGYTYTITTEKIINQNKLIKMEVKK